MLLHRVLHLPQLKMQCQKIRYSGEEVAALQSIVDVDYNALLMGGGSWHLFRQFNNSFLHMDLMGSNWSCYALMITVIFFVWHFWRQLFSLSSQMVGEHAFPNGFRHESFRASIGFIEKKRIVPTSIIDIMKWWTLSFRMISFLSRRDSFGWLLYSISDSQWGYKDKNLSQGLSQRRTSRSRRSIFGS